MIQSEVICRVLRIVCDKKCGSTFTLEVEGKQYLATVKHLFEDVGYPPHYTIGLFLDAGYISKEVDIYYHINPNIDIAILSVTPHEILTQEYDNLLTSNGVALGQDVFFLGFPFEYDQMAAKPKNRGVPTPFVKKACLSSIQVFPDGSNLLILDGINNHGFSGGPVCFKPIGSRSMSICGIVSSYRYDNSPIRDVNDKIMPYSVRENTGIIHTFNISHAIEIIKSINN